MRVLLAVLLAVVALVDGNGGGPVGYQAGPSAIAQYSPQFAGPDFNPVLLQGSRGLPGIRARINQRAFQYASGLMADVLNQEIKRARIPPISQCIPMVQGCVQIYNLFVSRYRCPQRVVLYPAPPNRIVVQVQNVDIGVTGNLGGQITVLLPIALFGIVQLNLHQVSITVELGIERGPSGPYVRVLSCNVQIGYADAYIENGGLVGQIVNSQFRSQISNQVKQMVPGQVCAQLPSIVNEKLNSKLGGLPQTVALSQMLSFFGSALGLGGGAAPPQCSAKCPAGSTEVVQPVVSSPSTAPVLVSGPAPAPQIPNSAYVPGRRSARARGLSTDFNSHPKTLPSQLVSLSHDAPGARHYRTIPYFNDHRPQRVLYVPSTRAKRQAVAQRIYLNQLAATPAQVRQFRQAVAQAAPSAPYLAAAPRIPPPPTVAVAPPPQAVQQQTPNLCVKCPAGQAEDPASFLRQIAAHLDLSKLNDMYLSVQMLNTYATSNDFTVDLSGEFSPNAQGGTPFGPFPVAFPGAYDNHMLELIISDYTVNSLFYHLHRKQFLSFRIGPETPKIGELLKTTCSDDSDDLEATEVELDEEEARRRRRLANAVSFKTLLRNKRAASPALPAVPLRPTRVVASAARLHGVTTITTKRKRDSRNRRQDDTAGLADLGICFGDILPAIREKYPNQKIYVLVRTTRAPSIILSAARGGTAILDLIADADIFIDGTNNRVGTITIAATVQLVVNIVGNRVTGTAEITQLRLSDHAQTLGLPQDALDNLGNLGKELLQKVANDALQKGITISLPQQLPIPISIVNPSVRIIEHGLYIATDITVSPSLLGIGGGAC